MRTVRRIFGPAGNGLSRFCSITLGSAGELQYFLVLARDLELLQAGDHDRLAEKTVEVKRMLTGLLQKLKAAR